MHLDYSLVVTVVSLVGMGYSMANFLGVGVEVSGGKRQFAAE
jgi:hypothetical protein